MYRHNSLSVYDPPADTTKTTKEAMIKYCLNSPSTHSVYCLLPIRTTKERIIEMFNNRKNNQIQSGHTALTEHNTDVVAL